MGNQNTQEYLDKIKWVIHSIIHYKQNWWLYKRLKIT
jgi:hypothetical protein